jgi:hypothetical protein
VARDREGKKVYRIAFHNDGKLYELYARGVSASSLFGFVEVEGLLFGERTAVVVDPTEEHLRAEFEGVERTFIPIHAVVRVDQVTKRGVAKVTALPGGDKVRALPSPVLVPRKREP